MATSPASSINNSSATGGAYVPGVCNINRMEIARRRKAAYILLAITVAFATPLLLLDIPNWTRLLLLFPIFLTVVCSLQVRYKFCVGYGAVGMQNAIDGDKVAQDIVDAAAKKLDKDRTRKIKLQSAGIAVIVTLILTVLPV